MLRGCSVMKQTIVHLGIALVFVSLMHADQTVQSVQQALKDQGFYYGNATGDKSAETTSAIRRYQIRNGLPVTGQIDPETLQSLNVRSTSNSVASSQSSSKPAVTQPNSARSNGNPKAEQNSSPPASTEPNRQPDTNPAYSSAYYQPAPSRTSKRMAIAELQRQLMTRGYYQGRSDGKYGRRTALALRAFQFDAGLPPTGQLDTNTLQTLGLSDANLAYSHPASRISEARVPVWKFKHGKWKLKWKKDHGHERDSYDDQEAAERADAWWNGYNQDE
jgi:peptidoglycan hydrolase-like protein with peptidoglycan-binding domain